MRASEIGSWGRCDEVVEGHLLSVGGPGKAVALTGDGDDVSTIDEVGVRAYRLAAVLNLLPWYDSR